MQRSVRRRRIPRAGWALGWCLSAATAVASETDYYLSIPSKGGIWRADAQTVQVTPFALGLGVPFYGFFEPGGDLIIPDRLFGAVLRIDPAGGIGIVSAGGLLSSVVTVTPAPGGGFAASDLLANRVVHVDANGQQSLIHDEFTSGGLLVGPGGLAYAPDGALYVANNVGNTIVRIAPSGAIATFSDSPLIQTPGGIAIDRAGNLFCAMYASDRVVRFRLDTGEAEPFADSQPPQATMKSPNDLKLSRSGGLLTTTRNSSLLRIDALGQIDVILNDPTLGEIDGIAVPEDATPCSGSFVTYGVGTAGASGIAPRLTALFSPCPGADVALEFRGIAAGAPTALFIGTSPASIPFYGGTLLVNPTGPFVVVPFTHPGGNLVLPFTLAADPLWIGAQLYMQCAAAEPTAPQGVALSNGLHETIGS
jgi:hypothetical protein